MSIRDTIREKIFASKELARKEVEFFGEMIELRQSSLGDILDAQNEGDQKGAIVKGLIRSAYIPKTDEKVFEEADADSLLQLPFGADFTRVAEGLAELTNVNFLDKGPIS